MFLYEIRKIAHRVRKSVAVWVRIARSHLSAGTSHSSPAAPWPEFDLAWGPHLYVARDALRELRCTFELFSRVVLTPSLLWFVCGELPPQISAAHVASKPSRLRT